ncbi:MAG: hypothetical protein JWO32_2970 [Bacteroidetes bacterium]|nr:hypothetical protein [Bacteroidota bacterium]
MGIFKKAHASKGSGHSKKSKRHHKNIGDKLHDAGRFAMSANKNRMERHDKNKLDKREFKLAKKGVGRENRGAAMESFMSVLGGVAGTALNVLHPNGEIEHARTAGDGTLIGEDGRSFIPKQGSQAHISNEDAEKLEAAGHNTTNHNMSYTDENHDFIDDVTGKYIYKKEPQEGYFEWLKRLILHFWSGGIVSKIGVVLGFVVIVGGLLYTAVKGLPKLFKVIKKKLRF